MTGSSHFFIPLLALFTASKGVKPFLPPPGAILPPLCGRPRFLAGGGGGGEGGVGAGKRGILGVVFSSKASG